MGPETYMAIAFVSVFAWFMFIMSVLWEIVSKEFGAILPI